MNKNNLQIIKFKLIDYLVVCLLFAGVFSFLYFSGTLNSGYHFADDHEFIRINADLGNTSFLETAANEIKRDINCRFRPMYYLHRIFEIKIFETDILLLSFYTGLLASLTLSFFYFGARKLRYTVFESLLFVFLVFVGLQARIWWLLGPAETIGMFFLGLSFVFLTKSAENKKYLLDSILFNIFLISASLCKESFAIIIPAFVFYKVWNESMAFKISIKKSIQNNYFSIFSLAVMALELYIIIFVVGTNKLGYAGIVSNPADLFRGIWIIFIGEDMLFAWIKLVLVITGVYSLSFLFVKNDKFVKFKKSIKQMLLPILILFLILLPNLLLYAKSGMTHYYLLPTTFGIALFIINMLKNINNNILRKIAFLSCVIFIYFSFSRAVDSASAFTKIGMQTNVFLSAAEKNAKSNSNILLVIDPFTGFERTYSIKLHLSSKGINNLYFYPMSYKGINKLGFYPMLRDNSSDFERNLITMWEKEYGKKAIKDMSEQPDLILIVDKNQAEGFFDQSGISKLNYTNLIEDSNPHAVYLKK